jgi:hypothetical protein
VASGSGFPSWELVGSGRRRWWASAHHDGAVASAHHDGGAACADHDGGGGLRVP